MGPRRDNERVDLQDERDLEVYTGVIRARDSKLGMMLETELKLPARPARMPTRPAPPSWVGLRAPKGAQASLRPDSHVPTAGVLLDDLDLSGFANASCRSLAAAHAHALRACLV